MMRNFCTAKVPHIFFGKNGSVCVKWICFNVSLTIDVIGFEQSDPELKCQYILMIYECAVSLAFTISPLLSKRMHQLHGPLILLDKTNLGFLHGPPILVFKTNFGLVLYNHAKFYRFEETFSYWSVKRTSVFLCFSLINQRHTSSITVYNHTATKIENTMRAVHSCNNWF